VDFRVFSSTAYDGRRLGVSVRRNRNEHTLWVIFARDAAGSRSRQLGCAAESESKIRRRALIESARAGD